MHNSLSLNLLFLFDFEIFIVLLIIFKITLASIAPSFLGLLLLNLSTFIWDFFRYKHTILTSFFSCWFNLVVDCISIPLIENSFTDFKELLRFQMKILNDLWLLHTPFLVVHVLGQIIKLDKQVLISRALFELPFDQGVEELLLSDY